MRVRLMTSSPTAFIMRSRRSSEMRTDFACGRACGGCAFDLPAQRFAVVPVRCGRCLRFPAGVAASPGFGYDFFGREFGDAREQRIDGGAHFRIACPLAVQKLLQDVHRLEANIHDFGARLQCAVAQLADQIFHAVGDGRKPMQADLRRRTFHRVNGAEQAIDSSAFGLRFESEQAFGHGLQMLFGLGNEKFENFVRHFAILRQVIGKRICRCERIAARLHRPTSDRSEHLADGCARGRRRETRTSSAA